MLLPLAFDLGYENRIGYVCLLMVIIFESFFFAYDLGYENS